MTSIAQCGRERAAADSGTTRPPRLLHRGVATPSGGQSLAGSVRQYGTKVLLPPVWRSRLQMLCLVLLVSKLTPSQRSSLFMGLWFRIVGRLYCYTHKIKGLHMKISSALRRSSLVATFAAVLGLSAVAMGGSTTTTLAAASVPGPDQGAAATGSPGGGYPEFGRLSVRSQQMLVASGIMEPVDQAWCSSWTCYLDGDCGIDCWCIYFGPWGGICFPRP